MRTDTPSYLETLSFGSLYPWNPPGFSMVFTLEYVLLINVHSKYGIANPRKERRITLKKHKLRVCLFGGLL
jgi:hypothetical protein